MAIAVAGFQSPINAILNIIGQKLEDEASTIIKFSADFGRLQERVEHLQLYLEDASDKILHDKPKLFQRWITDLHSAAMDAEDLVEICSLPLENDDLDDHKSQREGISSCIFCVPFSWLSKTVSQLLFHRKIGKQIKEVNARLSHLTDRANEYGIQQLLFHHKIEYGIQQIVYRINASSAGDEVAELRVETKFLDDESTSVDIERKTDEILSLIDKHKAVAVVGMGGSGKTRLLKHVVKSLESSSRYGKCIWLCLSQKFTIEKLQREVLAATVDIQNPEGSLAERVQNPEGSLFERVHKRLEKQNYVVVFDDMWALSEGQKHYCQTVLEIQRSIGLPQHSGAKTLVSTRDCEVARQLRAEIYDMPLLSPEKSKELLLKHLPLRSKALMTAGNLRSLVGAVLRRCGGLPLAILAAAGALNSENVNEWCSILQQMMDTSSSRRLAVSSDDSQVVTINAFRLSYNALNYREKLCFEFLGVLAEDEEIDAGDLVAMWKGERLVENTGQGMTILKQLWRISLLQLHYRNNCDHPVVRMHDVVHLLAVGLAQQSRGVFEIEALHKQSIRRISLAKVPLDPAVKSVSCPRSVRTLRLTGDESLTEIPSQFLANACNLRVLDLNGNRNLERLPINCFKKMRLLKFLDIRGTKIREVAECVRHLTSLEFLGTDFERDVPVWIGELQCLDTFRCNARWNNATVVPMPQLRNVKPITIKISSNSSRGNKPELWSWDSFCSQLTHLEQVSLIVEEFEDGKTPPCTLQDLRLEAAERGRGREEEEAVRDGGMIMSMPDKWFLHLYNLQHLSLWRLNFAPPPGYVGHSLLCSLTLSYVDCDEYSGTISHLPHLKELRMLNNRRCKNLPAEFGRRGAFPSLTSLGIGWLDELRTLPKLEEGAMPRLSRFRLHDCMKLEEADGCWKQKLRTLAKTGGCHIVRIKNDLQKELEGGIKDDSGKALARKSANAADTGRGIKRERRRNSEEMIMSMPDEGLLHLNNLNTCYGA